MESCIEVVWKVALPIEVIKTQKAELTLPKGAVALSTQIVNGELCTWFLVDPEFEKGKAQIVYFSYGGKV